MPGLARGCPQRLSVTQARSSRPTSILAMGLDGTGHYLAILTRHDLQVWHGGQYNILLGHCTLKGPGGGDAAAGDGQEEEEEESDDGGPFVKPAVVWSRSSKEVCVLGLDGALAFFEVAVQEQDPVFKDIDPPEWMDLPPGDGGLSPWLDSPLAVGVKQLRTLPDVKGTCLTAGLWSHHLLIGKDKEAALLDVSWSGIVAAEYHLQRPRHASEYLYPQHHPSHGHEGEGEGEEEEEGAAAVLVHLDYSDVCHLLAAVLSDGRAVVCNVPSPTFSVQAVPVPTELSPGVDVMGAVEVATFSPVDAVLAVGYDDGSVAIYRVLYANTYASPSRSRQHHVPSLSDLGVSHSRSASTVSIDHSHSPQHPNPHEYSSSGSSVGVLYPSGGADDTMITLVLARRLSLDSLGFEIRHVGPVLTMEFSPDGGSLAVGHGWHSLNVWDTSQWCRPMTTFPRVPETPSELPSLGIACIVWGHRGYRLLVAQNELTEEHVSGSIIRYELLKWARHAAMADTPLCLQGVGSVALLEQRPWNPRLLSWAHINVPPAYAVNLPVALVAVSPSGQHVALAGRRGLALYNLSQRKWRLFGNVHQERELQVAGLAWWREEVVVVVAKQRTAFVILLYPRNHLDRASLLNEPVSLPPGTRPLFLDCVTDMHPLHQPHHQDSDSSTTAPSAPGQPPARAPSRLSSGSLDYRQRSRTQSSFLPPPPASSSPAGQLPPATLVVGDSTFLLTYRLARDEATGLASVTFLNDVKLPVHRGPRPPEPMPPSPTSSVRSATSASSSHPPSSSVSHHPPLTPQQLRPSHLSFGESPRRVCLLPGIQPPSVAILSSTGNLYMMELSDGSGLSLVGTGVSNFWELRLPSPSSSSNGSGEGLLRPCYLLYCGDNGFSLWLPSLQDDKASELTLEACRSPFLEPTFNPDVEGVLMGVHQPTNSLIFLTQTCLQPQMGPAHDSSSQPPIPPRFQVGLQRRPIYQVVFRYLLFLHGMLRGGRSSSYAGEDPASSSSLSSTMASTAHLTAAMGITATSKHHHKESSSWPGGGGGGMCEAVHHVVTAIFDELYAHPETRIHLADALDFLVRSCIEAVAIAHNRMKRKTTASKDSRDRSPFTSLATAIEQVREALLLCRRESSLTLFYEVIVRVARKVEPSRQKYIFPLPDLDGQGVGDTPVSLFDKCLRARKLHTAILYLPLIESHYAITVLPPLGASRSGVPLPEGQEAEDVRGLRLVHCSALKLLWECLRRNRREWRMLKQLWRFISKRQEALQARGALPSSSSSSHAPLPLPHASSSSKSSAPAAARASCSPPRPAPFQSIHHHSTQPPPPPETPKRPLLGLLYRVTVGMITPSASSSYVDKPATHDDSHAASASSPTDTTTTSGSTHLGTNGAGGQSKTASGLLGSEGDGQDDEDEEGEPEEEEPGPPADVSFHLLRYAETGRDVVTLFCSLCLCTLRLKDLIDALLLLNKPDPLSVPYPSLRRFPGHRLPDLPWARFEAPTDILLDCFLAIREQFTDSTNATAALAPHHHHRHAPAAPSASSSPHCGPEQRLGILQTICRELRDFECLLALGTFQKDADVVRQALSRGRVSPEEYCAIFLDDRLEVETGIRDMVRAITTPADPDAAAAAAAAKTAAPSGPP